MNTLDVGIRSYKSEHEILPEAITDNSSSLPEMHERHLCSDSTFNITDCHGIVHEFQSKDHWFSSSTEALLITCYCVVILFGLVSNSVVCFIVLRFKHLQKPRNILILNLSVCGILMCVACMPFSLVRLTLKNWTLGEMLCRLSPTLQTVDVFVSTFTIVAIALDRYSAIVCAQRETANKSIVYYSIALIWLTSVLFCIPMFTFHEVQEVYPELYNICLEVWPSDTLKKTYTTIVLVTQYVVPLVIISLLHGRICMFLKYRISENPITETEVKRMFREVKRHRRNMLLLTAIAASFAIAWLPLTILNTLADYDFRLFLNRNFNDAYAFCLLIAMCSACMNPIIYGWFNSNFRKAFLQIICWQKTVSVDPTEMATIKNDSKGNSNQPFRFYSSLNLDVAAKTRTPSSKTSRSGSVKCPLARQVACMSPTEPE